MSTEVLICLFSKFAVCGATYNPNFKLLYIPVRLVTVDLTDCSSVLY